jgi:hypothetical protein
MPLLRRDADKSLAIYIFFTCIIITTTTTIIIIIITIIIIIIFYDIKSIALYMSELNFIILA